MNEEEKTLLTVRYPLFIMFAEYLGYESPIIEWAEKWCSGKTIPEYQRNIIKVDAISIFKKMKKEYTISELHKWYEEFFEVVFSMYERNIMKLEDEESKKIPF